MLWVNKHKAWNFSQWKNVVFSDESIFGSYSAHGKHWVLRTENNKGKPENMHETMSHGPQLHVWGCFSSNGIGLLKRIECSMDAKLYQASIDVVVQHHWYSLDRKFCQNLLESMPKQVKFVINMEGYPTKY